MDRTVRIRVRGYVQGVGFRYFVQRLAGPLGVSGWCRNLRTGEVEILASAPDPELQEFLERLREGPGRVVDLAVESCSDPVGPGFDILKTP